MPCMEVALNKCGSPHVIILQILFIFLVCTSPRIRIERLESQKNGEASWFTKARGIGVCAAPALSNPLSLYHGSLASNASSSVFIKR